MNLLAPARSLQKSVRDKLELSGKAADAEQTDWDSTDWDWGCQISAESELALLPHRVVIAVVRFAPDSKTKV